MQLMPLGDYYGWYCDWCDSRNLTLWTRIENNELCCAACHREFPVFEEAAPAGRGKGELLSLLLGSR